MKKKEIKVLKKLDYIIGDMLESQEYPALTHHYDRLLTLMKDENSVRIQLVMALMAEIAHSKSDEINEELLQYYLVKLPVESTSDL